MRSLVAALACIASPLLFAVGLVAPLTPSEGCPSDPALGLFAIVPVLLPAGTSLLVRRVAARLALWGESLAIAASATWLLQRIGCLA